MMISKANNHHELRSKLSLINSNESQHQITSSTPRPKTTGVSLSKFQDFSCNQPALILNDSSKIPLIGLGTWNAQGKELKQAVKHAIIFGYRHIDTAANYRNETTVGEAIAECIAEGFVTRKELYVTTKLWNNSHLRASVPQALRVSLKALQLNYVDLYLIHYPIGYKEGKDLSPLDDNGVVITNEIDYVETWKGMQDSQELGLCRSIGVSNFSKQQLKRVLVEATIVPAMNQVECHPYLNQSSLLDFCRKHCIAVTAYSPLGSPGRITQNFSGPLLMKDSVIKAMAMRYNASAGQILISYQLQRGIVAIPKAVQREHLEKNFEALSLKLSDDDLRKLDGLNRNLRYMLFERCIGHKFYPFVDTDEDEDDTDSCGSI